MNLKELRQLERENPLKWTDPSLSNTVRISRVFLTLASTDTPLKAEMCNHMNFNGYYSCPYCQMAGVVVRTANFLEAFDGSNPFAGSSGRNVVKFSKLVHQSNCRLCENEERLRIGREVTLEKLESGLSATAMQQIHRCRITGIPVIHSMSKFQDVWGHTSGILHIVCEGFAKVSFGYLCSLCIQLSWPVFFIKWHILCLLFISGHAGFHDEHRW